MAALRIFQMPATPVRASPTSRAPLSLMRGASRLSAGALPVTFTASCSAARARARSTVTVSAPVN